MSEKSGAQADKQSATRKQAANEGPVEKVQSEQTSAAAAYRSMLGDQALSPDKILSLQRTVGNQTVNQIVSQTLVMRQNGDGRTLAQALGFETVFEDPGRVVDTAHPIISNIITLTRDLLVAQFVEHDQAHLRSVYTQVSRLYDQLRDVIRGAGRHAPHQALWSMEEMALMRILGEAESGPRYARLGSYTRGRERHSVRHLRSLNQRVARVLSPQAGRAATNLPGGSVERKIYLGSVPGPTFILNFYLILKITLQGRQGGAGQASVGTSTDESGATTPSAGATAQTSGGGALSAAVSAGESGPQGTAGVQGTGPGGSTTQAQVDTSGDATGTVTVPMEGNWTQQLQITSSGNVTYQVRNNRQAGLQLRGNINSVSLTAMAPELRMGQASVQPKIQVEVVPNRQLWASSATQSAATIAAFQRAYVLSLLGMASVPLAAAATESLVVLLFGAEAAEGTAVVLTLAGA